MRFSTFGLSALVLSCATPAFAQDETAAPGPITVSGSVTLASDYRFRGISQTDKGFALQGGATVSHESGAYAGFWGSNLAGWGAFGGPNLELDLFAGYSMPIGDGGKIDVGATWYMYPDGANTTDFIEPYVKLSGTVGPVSLTASVFYAPPQEALGRVFFTGADAAAGVPNDPGDKEDNLYLAGDALAAIPNTPVSLRAHIGYSDGNSGLGPNGTSIAPTGTFWDYAVGADVSYEGLTLGVTYIGTDISDADGAYLRPNFSKGGVDSIADGTVVFSLTAAF